MMSESVGIRHYWRLEVGYRIKFFVGFLERFPVLKFFFSGNIGLVQPKF